MNHYDVLRVRHDATADEIKAAYRRMALDMHPDRHPEDPEAGARFARVNEAHSVLSDPAQRAEYDASLNAEIPVAPEDLEAINFWTGLVTDVVQTVRSSDVPLAERAQKFGANVISRGKTEAGREQVKAGVGAALQFFEALSR